MARWHHFYPEVGDLGRVVRPGAVCLDLGAGCGAYSWALSVLAGPAGQVHCVDSPDRPARWAAVTSLFGCADIVVHRDEGPSRTVDALCRQAGLENVDFIRADVADTEPSALMGAFSTLLRDRPSLLLDIEDRRLANCAMNSADVVRSLTKSLGYSMYCWRDGAWEPAMYVTANIRNYLFTSRPLSRG
ncbi:hypothetical protein ACWD6R_37505 [Streptomyces sp. NPDC005151]